MEQARHPETNTDPEQQYREAIKARDEKFAIEEFPVEDTLQTYLVKRSDGTVEKGWYMVGAGPERGKLVKMSEATDGMPPVKYESLEKLMTSQAELSAEYERQQAALREELAETAVEEVVAPVEAKERQHDPYAYLREVLPPVVKPVVEQDSRSWEERQRFYRPETPEEKQLKYYNKFVTPANREASLETLAETVKKNPQIVSILEKAGLSVNDIAAVDAIREDPDVRYEVARHLAQKLDSMAESDPQTFGWRVADNPANNLKVDPQTGRRMRSRDYAVSMALKMIGGEFSERHEANDFERDANDRPAVGQHRHAASTILMSY